MVTPHLPWKFHANRSSRFLVMLLTKKQRKKSPENNNTPSPYRGRGNKFPEGSRGDEVVFQHTHVVSSDGTLLRTRAAAAAAAAAGCLYQPHPAHVRSSWPSTSLRLRRAAIEFRGLPYVYSRHATATAAGEYNCTIQLRYFSVRSAVFFVSKLLNTSMFAFIEYCIQ